MNTYPFIEIASFIFAIMTANLCGHFSSESSFRHFVHSYGIPVNCIPMEASTIGSFMMTTALIVKHPMIFAPIYRFSFGVLSDAIVSSDMYSSPAVVFPVVA